MRDLPRPRQTRKIAAKQLEPGDERTRCHGIRRGHGGRRPGRPGLRDPPETAQARTQRLRDRKGLDHRRAHSVRRGDRTAAAGRVAAGLAQVAAAGLRTGRQGRILVPDENRRLEIPDRAAADEQPRQLHRLARRHVRLAGAAGRGAGRGDLSGLRRRRTAVRRTRRRLRRAHRRHGRGQGRFAQARLHAGHRHPREDHRARRRRARTPEQAADPQVRPRSRLRSAKLFHRHQGALAGPGRSLRTRQDRAQHGLAGRFENLRRQFPVSPGRRSHRARLRFRPRLSRPELPALRSFPAMEEPSEREVPARRRNHSLCRRARDRDGRLAIAAQARDARRDPDRRRRRPAQRAEDQGHAPGDALGHAGGRTHRRAGQARRLGRETARLGRDERTAQGAQLQARLQEGSPVRLDQFRLGDDHRRPVAVDDESFGRLHDAGEARRRRAAQARLRRTYAGAARSPRRRVLRRHRTRRGPARAPARGRHRHLHHDLRHRIRQSLHALLPGRRLRDRQG